MLLAGAEARCVEVRRRALRRVARPGRPAATRPAVSPHRSRRPRSSCCSGRPRARRRGRSCTSPCRVAGGVAEVGQVGPAPGGVVLVVADRGPGAGLVASPGRVVVVHEVVVGAARIGACRRAPRPCRGSCRAAPRSTPRRGVVGDVARGEQLRIVVRGRDGSGSDHGWVGPAGRQGGPGRVGSVAGRGDRVGSRRSAGRPRRAQRVRCLRRCAGGLGGPRAANDLASNATSRGSRIAMSRPAPQSTRSRPPLRARIRSRPVRRSEQPVVGPTVAVGAGRRHQGRR